MKRVSMLGLTLGAALSVAPGLRAQDAAPNPASPGECVQDLRAFYLKNLVDLGFFSAEHVPKDSIRNNVAVRAKVCIDKFPLAAVKGKQLDNLAIVYVRANQDKLAQDIFARRLAEKGLTPRDKQLALEAAVEAFADPEAPDRLPTAEKYMKMLDAEPAVANLEKISGHAALANAYRRLDKEDQVISNGELAIKLAQVMDQRDRGGASRMLELAYQDVAEIYSTMPDGKAKMEALATTLLTPKIPDDSYLTEYFQMAINRSKMLGTTAPPITANWWLNSDLKGMQTVDIASQKKLRVLQFAAFG